MQNYHKHDSYSNIYVPDSAAVQEDYAKRAVEVGHKVLSSVQHGWAGYYFETFELAKKYDLKFIFGAEAYWVKDRHEKDRTNSHVILLAKNENGRRAINRIMSDANEDGYYFRPRVDMELLLSLPADDVMITTACIAFWHYEDIEDLLVQLHSHFKSNLFLEIQYHNTDPQINLNKRILALSEKYGIEMLKAGTNLGAKSDADIVDGDAKTFELGGKKVRIGQVNTVDLDDVFARQADLESQMQSMMDDNDYDLFLLIATNILNSDSELLVIGDPAEKVEAAFGKKLNENKRMNLPGVVSRKKQVVPPLTDAFEG